jgi:hypothetical protein
MFPKFFLLVFEEIATTLPIMAFTVWNCLTTYFLLCSKKLKNSLKENLGHISKDWRGREASESQ